MLIDTWDLKNSFLNPILSFILKYLFNISYVVNYRFHKNMNE